MDGVFAPRGLALVQACYLVDEANMITREVRPEEPFWKSGEPEKACLRDKETGWVGRNQWQWGV